MSLQDVKNKLYKEKKDEETFRLGETRFDPRFAPSDQAKENFSREDVWIVQKEEIRKARIKFLKRTLIFSGGVLLFIFLIAGFLKFRQMAFDQERVRVLVEGPQEVPSGRSLSYEIKYKNENRATLENASLKISFPKNFVPEDNPGFKMEGTTASVLELGNIAGKKEGKITFKGKIFSPKGSLLYLQAGISYTPSNLNSQFTSQNQLSVTVKSSPVILEITAPQNLAKGDAIDYQINYRNEGEKEIEEMRIKMDYPEGFTFSKVSPENLEGENPWSVGKLAPGQSGKIIVSGKLTGERDYIRTAKAYIGVVQEGEFVVYDEENVVTKIVGSPLAISQWVNGRENLNINFGETLRFEIRFRNEGEIGLRDVIVTEKLEGEALDWASLRLENGGFDSNSKIITWKAGDLSLLKKLEPGQEGKIKFTINVKNSPPIKEKSDKNFVVSSLAKIDSPDVPTPLATNKIIAGNQMDLKVNSRISLDTQGYFYDQWLENSGPLPPQVGKETTYAIHWKIFNASNELSDARVEAIIPTGATVVDFRSKEGEELHYNFNERTNMLVWEIGKVAPGVGFLSSSQEVVFQIKIKPSPSQVGSYVELLKENTFIAQDLFTQEELRFSGKEKSTFLQEDMKLKMEDYKVASGS